MSRRSVVRGGGVLLLLPLLLAGCVSVEEERANRENLARLHLDEGKALYDAGKHEEAIHAYSEAIETHPRPYALAYCRRGNAHFRLGHDAEAVADYSAALQVSPGFQQALFNRAETYRRMGRWSEALRDFQDYHQSNPSDAPSLKRIGELVYEHIPSKRREALEFLEQYLKIAGPDEAVERRVEELRRELEAAPPR